MLDPRCGYINRDILGLIAMACHPSDAVVVRQIPLPDKLEFHAEFASKKIIFEVPDARMAYVGFFPAPGQASPAWYGFAIKRSVFTWFSGSQCFSPTQKAELCADLKTFFVDPSEQKALALVRTWAHRYLNVSVCSFALLGLTKCEHNTTSSTE